MEITNVINLLKSYNSISIEFFNNCTKRDADLIQNIEESGVSSVYDNYIKKINDDLITFMDEWELAPNDLISDTSPVEFSKSLNNNDMIKLFLLSSIFVEVYIPNFVKNRIFSKEFEEIIIKLSVDETYRSELFNSLELEYIQDIDEHLINIQISSINIIKENKLNSAIPHLIDLIYKNDNIDSINDIICEALDDLDCQDAIIEKLENISLVTKHDEYLFSVLAKVASKNKTDKVFKILKNKFILFEDKSFAALLFKDYNDPKAITFLRGFAEKNLFNIDQITFYEIKHTVESLGGNMDDIVFPKK